MDRPKTAGLVVALALFAPPAAHAAAGFNVAWNECILAPTATQDRTFACNVNMGADWIVVSFVAPAEASRLGMMETHFEVVADAPTFPSWWTFGSGTCRGPAGLVIQTNPYLWFTCDIDAWYSAASGLWETVGAGAPNRAEFRGLLAQPVGDEAPLVAGVEYYGYCLRLAHTGSTGAGACPGCDVRMCIRVEDVDLYLTSADSAPVSRLTTPLVRGFVTWQGAATTLCMGVVPARNRTWGEIRSLYR